MQPNSLKGLGILILLILSFEANAWNNNPTLPEGEDPMCLREYITGWAQNYLGIRYKWAGRDPNTGFDCSGLLSYVFEEYNLDLPHGSYYQSKMGVKVPLNETVPGDLIFFGTRNRIRHVAMVVERTEEGIFCVHATSSRGVIVENILESSYWKPKIMFARDVISEMVENNSITLAVNPLPGQAANKHTTFLCHAQTIAFDINPAVREPFALGHRMFDIQEQSIYTFQ